MTNKVQINKHGTNVLVETTNGNARSIWHGNREVNIVKIVSQEDLLKEWDNVEREVRIHTMAKILSKKPGFAVSHVNDKEQGIKRDDIVVYELKKF